MQVYLNEKLFGYLGETHTPEAARAVCQSRREYVFLAEDDRPVSIRLESDIRRAAFDLPERRGLGYSDEMDLIREFCARHNVPDYAVTSIYRNVEKMAKVFSVVWPVLICSSEHAEFFFDRTEFTPA